MVGGANDLIKEPTQFQCFIIQLICSHYDRTRFPADSVPSRDMSPGGSQWYRTA